MAGKFLLDTNIVIALFAKDESVETKMKDANAVWISSIVLGELYFGARKSGRVEANVKHVEDFENRNAVLSCDADTAKHFAIIKNQLRLIGKPIPENDIWIAALALQHELILVTRDAHFETVADLKIENW